MSYRGDAVDMIAGQIEKEEKEAGVSSTKHRGRDKKLKVDAKDVERVAEQATVDIDTGDTESENEDISEEEEE